MKYTCNWCGKRFKDGYDNQYCSEGCYIKANDNYNFTIGISADNINPQDYYKKIEDYWKNKEW
jgi:hypothetical protein